MPEKRTYKIDGAAFSDLDGFYDELGEQLLAGAPWERSLDGLNDLLRGAPGLRGALGPLPREFRLVWEHSDLSRRRLGTSGRGSFLQLLEIIASHPNVELVLS